MDWTEILDTLIKVGIPALITIITGKKLKRQANKHSARQSILQLIIEDHVRVMEHKLPENYQAILDEFDEYKSNGGNSYIQSKVTDYVDWYGKINKRKESK
jgi:hypothetical protein